MELGQIERHGHIILASRSVLGSQGSMNSDLVLISDGCMPVKCLRFLGFTGSSSWCASSSWSRSAGALRVGLVMLQS